MLHKRSLVTYYYVKYIATVGDDLTPIEKSFELDGRHDKHSSAPQIVLMA